MRFPPEVEGLCVVWSHINDLVSDCDARLVFLQLEFADDEVRETCQLESIQVFCCLLELIGALVFFLEIVAGVAEVEVAIDFLVDFRCFLVVTHLEELSSCDFQPRDICKLVYNGEFVEVRRVLYAEEGDGKLDCVTFFEGSVLVKEVALEVGVEFVCYTGGSHCGYHILLH